MQEEGQRLPKPDWNQFNPLRAEQQESRPPPPNNRRPTQKRPTVFSNYYTKREAATAETRLQPPPPHRGGSRPPSSQPTYQRTSYNNHNPINSSTFGYRGGRGRGGSNSHHESYAKFPNSTAPPNSTGGWRPPFKRNRGDGRGGGGGHNRGGYSNRKQGGSGRNPRTGESTGGCGENSKVQLSHPNDSKPVGRVQYLYPTGDTIKPEGLEKLTQEPLKTQIDALLKSQRLRDKIKSLDSSPDPRKLMNSFTEDREFSEFRTFIIENLSNDLFR